MNNKNVQQFNFAGYDLQAYLNDIEHFGLSTVWDAILSWCLKNEGPSGIVSVPNFGELYEIGLAQENKTSKKELGKYYTPEDVASIMSEWFDGLKAQNVCDVCCGTGNLILAYLSFIGKTRARNLIKRGNLYLYDCDETALKICKFSIAILYGEDLLDSIRCVCGDFLDRNVHLPEDCKVISNPPYYKITTPSPSWEITDVIQETRELYSAFFEKIIKGSTRSVIITPYSFLGGDKFYSLRNAMNNYNGFVVSFDNIPGSIFNGRKHGVFNSNTTNSVRAAITVVENKRGKRGFMLSPLIRFKTHERKELLNCQTLENLVNPVYQTVNDKKTKFYKCFKEHQPILAAWMNNSKSTLRDLVSDKETEYRICVPTSCRYFTTAAKKDLKRTGKRYIFAKDQTAFDFLYCLLNSSLTYWHWRLYDGGINFPLGLLYDLPTFLNLLSDEEIYDLHKIATEMQRKERQHLVYKLNAAAYQENVKFPEAYREKINRIFLRSFGINASGKELERIHSCSIFSQPRKEGKHE